MASIGLKYPPPSQLLPNTIQRFAFFNELSAVCYGNFTPNVLE